MIKVLTDLRSGEGLPVHRWPSFPVSLHGGTDGRALWDPLYKGYSLYPLYKALIHFT